MVNDQEPRYRLVDADANVVGSLFAESDGTLKLQEGTSGNDNGLSLTTQGALEVEQVDITPHAEGTVTVSGGTREIVDNDTRYNSGFWIIAVSVGNKSTDNGRIETKWEGSGTDGSVNAVLEEVKGNTTAVSWATIQLS